MGLHMEVIWNKYGNSMVQLYPYESHNFIQKDNSSFATMSQKFVTSYASAMLVDNQAKKKWRLQVRI